ncbi:hypothetical protein LZ30DRAFT_722265 [Colletotrichum cereale]|nr:hypothetical protein LZ30DRAFT_722265 [Colletotrichum cereale]
MDRQERGEKHSPSLTLALHPPTLCDDSLCIYSAKSGHFYPHFSGMKIRKVKAQATYVVTYVAGYSE